MLAIYVSTLNPEYSRSGVYFSGDSGERIFKKISRSKIIQVWEIFLMGFRFNPKNAVLIVMSPNHSLVIWFKILTKFQIILDAGWPLSDSSEYSKNPRKLLQHVKNLVIDYFCFHLADIVVLESELQKEFVSQKFLVMREKLAVILTGFNEKEFEKNYICPEVPREIDQPNLQNISFVLFRGKLNRESGIFLILETARLMDPSVKFIIVTNIQIEEVPKNVILIARHVTKSELIWLYKNALCVLGQISNHQRLEKTIPHKLFEAAYYSKCYVSPNSKGVSEILEVDSFKQVTLLSPTGLKNSLESVLIDTQVRLKYESAVRKSYEKHATQKELSAKLRVLIEFSSQQHS